MRGRFVGLGAGLAGALLAGVGAAQQPPTSAPPAPAAAEPTPAPADAPSAAAEQPPAPASDDSWSQLIKQGQKQERENETDEERERRADRQDREKLARVDQARQRPRIFAWAGLGAGLYDHIPTADEAATSFGATGTPTPWVFDDFNIDGFAPTLQLGAGVRLRVANHFDVHGRLMLSYQWFSGTTFGERYSGSGNYLEYAGPTYDASGVGLGAQATFRWLPGNFGPRFYLGLGPQVQYLFLSADIAAGSQHPAQEKDLGTYALQGVFEAGLIFGGQEEWDVNASASGGIVAHGQEAFQIIGTVARAFF